MFVATTIGFKVSFVLQNGVLGVIDYGNGVFAGLFVKNPFIDGYNIFGGAGIDCLYAVWWRNPWRYQWLTLCKYLVYRRET